MWESFMKKVKLYDMNPVVRNWVDGKFTIKLDFNSLFNLRYHPRVHQHFIQNVTSSIFTAFLLSPLVLLALITPVRSNCVDDISDPDFATPLFKRWFDQLKSRQSFPWGTVNPYDRFRDGRVYFNSDFDTLTVHQRMEVFDLLHLDLGGKTWYQLVQYYLPNRELEGIDPVRIGARHPFAVYGSDGRLLSPVYDGCTRMLTLTERARFQWYSLRGEVPPRHQNTVNRNTGYPSWRKVRYPITPQHELGVRQSFWRQIGWSYEREYRGWWIAWVPEHGWFEINIPSSSELPLLRKRFLNRPPQGWKFVVTDQSGIRF